MINQFSKEFALFFEKLRLSRNLTQEQFTKDIVSMRQYRRYIRGECLIPQYVVNKLSIRLGFKPEHIISEFDSERLSETQRVVSLFNSVVNQDYTKAKLLIKELKKEQFLDSQSQTLYIHSVNFYNHVIGKLSDKEIVKITMDLVDYKDLMKKSIFSAIELLIVTSLFLHESYTEKSRLAEKMNDFLQNVNMFTQGQNDNMMLLVIYQLAKYYGVNKEYKKVVSLCDKAIEYNLTNKNYYLLDYFYYFNALAHDKLENDSKVKDYLFRCFCILYADDNQPKIKKFTKFIETDFRINYKQFVINHIPNTY
jgi:transcriptional regulator with XRE-family HTH domain